MTNTNTTLHFSLAGTGTIVGCIILLVTFWTCHRRRIKTRRFRKFWRKITKWNSDRIQTLRSFSSEELQNATNDFHESARIGGGVYRGTLPDKTVVAVKVCYEVINMSPRDIFNVATALSKINHPNVVRLLGLCFENEVPLLVFEYISNGTLYEHLHGRNRKPLSAEMRMKAAAETAAALTCSHSIVPHYKAEITHGDVNPTKVLFDDNYTAKLDFNLYRRQPSSEPSSYMERTIEYLDPEYHQTSQLTEKSDVYSFGLVLAELLTSKRAIDHDRPEGQRELADMFASAIEAGTLQQILDKEFLKEGKTEIVKKLANLANRCMWSRGEGRPAMKEVATELEGLRIMWNQPVAMPKISESTEKTEPLVSPSDANVIDVRGECFDNGCSSI